jgi:phenylalanyl-tRNA synthetase alpha chain
MCHSADLKQTLLYFTKEMFGKSKIVCVPLISHLRKVLVDIYWGLKTETDYRITKGTGWLEIMGCGMVDLMFLKLRNQSKNITVLHLDGNRAYHVTVSNR